MPVKYVDPKTGEFLPNALDGTGAPSRYGIDTPEKLVMTSLSTSNSGKKSDDVFFMQSSHKSQAKNSKKQSGKKMVKGKAKA